MKEHKEDWTRIVSVVMLLLAAGTGLGQQPRIVSFGRNGELVCINLLPSTTAEVEWAPEVTGPWEPIWPGLVGVTVGPDGSIRTNMSMFPLAGNRVFYRVRGWANPDPARLAWIPPGTFTMGSRPDEPGRGSDEGPQTTVTISRGFFMGKYEVTQAEYQAVMGYNPSTFTGDPNRPVEQVSWSEATTYCYQLTLRERAAGRLPPDYEYRLPTEAEWEYACRAGTTTRFSFGDSDAALGSYAWYAVNSASSSHPVGQLAPNPWALYDMHGNVWEWCLDWYGASLPGGSVTDPTGPWEGSYHVLRGGSWIYDAAVCRSATRFGSFPVIRSSDLGFRVALAPVGGPNLVWIWPGTFTMGSPSSEPGRLGDEGPQTTVTISRGFWMGRSEVTQREYLAVMGNNPSTFTGDLNRPVERVSWSQATTYCSQLTLRERVAGRLPPNYEYRLPTEAQWEYACRAGTTTRFSFGDSDAALEAYGWYAGNSASSSHPVGQRAPNPWGLYDMHGNVWEWCLDWYRGSLPGGSVTDLQGPVTGSGRVIRGGGWGLPANFCRSACRLWRDPVGSDSLIGFRVVLVPVGRNLVWIPPGTFTMGSPETEPGRSDHEGPQTMVTMSRGFWMGKYEVTQGEYEAVMGDNPSQYTGDINRPVDTVSWVNATSYCALLTERERLAGRLPAGYQYRLPTEAEWEYACRAGTVTPFHYGEELRSGMANFHGQYEYPPCGTDPYYCYNPSGIVLDRTTAVGSYRPNAWGLYDMHGNVLEWCLDWYAESLPGGSVTDPMGPASGSWRVIRGGCWSAYARDCRSAYRFPGYSLLCYGAAGFRLVLAPAP